METQKTIIQAKPVTLSMDDQEEIITFVKQAWDRGKQDRKKYEDHWKECEDAYHCKMPPIESPELDWMSNICLPWAYDASESWYAHIHSTTIPKNDQIFTISGRTVEDHPGADIMQKYLEYRFQRNKFATQLGKAEKELAIRNHACLKVFWKEETTIEYNWVDEPVTQDIPDAVSGQVYQIQTGTKKVRKPQEKPVFSNVWIDVVDLDNFVMYPIRGDIDKTTRIHETYRHYEDLKASADKTNYFNLDELSLDDEKNSSSSGKKDEPDSLKQIPKGLNIKEAWISRVVINGQVYRNYIATVVNDKTLIRFQPFPPGCPKSPFVFMALRPDRDCFYGYGLNSKGLGILKSANKKFNGWIDEGQLTQHQAHKYYEDGVFNPANVVRRPGAMIKMSQQSVQDNVIPLIDNLQPQQELMQDLAALKVEFETVTVPKVVKGMIEVGNENTATEISQAQNNSNGKMHIDAYNVNDNLITSVLELSYQAIYDKVQLQQQGVEGINIIEDIQAVTQPKDPQAGAPMAELPILPLPEVDIKVVGYQNVIRKQETLAAMSQALPLLAQSPAAPYMEWGNTAEDVYSLMDLDKDRLLKNNEERQQIDQAAQQAQQQQQQLLEEKELGPGRLQAQKQDQEFQLKAQQQQMDYELRQEELLIKQVELQIKQVELQIKQEEMHLKAQEQAHNAAMGVHQAGIAEHSASMSERQQAFSEKQALKDNKGASKNG